MIRQIEHRDISTLLALGKEMHQEGHFKHTDYDLTKVTHLFTSIIEDDDKCCFIVEKDGKIIGFFMGYITEYYFGKDLTSYDLLLYVDQKHRGGRTGIKLLQCYIKWAKSWGVKDIRLGDSAEIDSEAVGRLFKFMGFREHGKLYILDKG